MQAGLDGTRVVFEVQLARVQLPRIIARERSYARAGIRLVWVVDADRLADDVWRQSHQDLLAGQGGRVVAIGNLEIAEVTLGRADLRSITMPRRDPVALCQLVTVREQDGGFDLDRCAMPLAKAVDLIAPADPAARPPLERDRLSRALFAALRDGDGLRIEIALGALCDLLGLETDVEAAQAEGLPEAVAALGTALTGTKCDASGFGATEATAILNTFLHTERHRLWAPMLAGAGQVSPCAAALLARESTARKLAAALAEPPAPEADPIPRWRPLVAHLFPQLREVMLEHSSAKP